MYHLYSYLLQQNVSYIDPGAGSILAQVIVGGAAGVAYFFKFYWVRIKDRLFASKTKLK